MLEYKGYTREKEGKLIWTDAFQKAIDENEYIIVPKGDEPYYIDDSILVRSNRHIEADPDAIIMLVEGVTVLLLRNEHTQDGTDFPIDRKQKDYNISICGGIWGEPNRGRVGYAATGRYSLEEEFYGVSTCMLFNNIENLSLNNMIFTHTAGFAIQIGDIKNAVFENIEFVECYADGLHINGNSESLFIKNIYGQVWDDLVAFNMYDWQNSSVNFGPTSKVWCEGIRSSGDSRYKALRILPGVYYYKDGSSVDCSLTDAVIKNISGIYTVKLYYQTSKYKIFEAPERGGVGTVNDVYFENIDIDLKEPVDLLPDYVDSNPITGSIAGFEFGSNIKNIYLDNIKVKLYRQSYPMSYFVCVGPKSVRMGEYEVFDPYVNSAVENLYINNLEINGEKISEIGKYVKEIQFDDIYSDNTANGSGKIRNIFLDGERITK